MFFDFRSRLFNHFHVDDVVATVDTIGSMTTDQHPDLLWNSLSGHIANPCSTQIVKMQSDVLCFLFRIAGQTLTTFRNAEGERVLCVPVIQAQVTLLPELSHGRRLLNTGQYRPHIVIGPQSQRVAIRNGNAFTQKYLGVMFVGGPESMSPGESAEVTLALMYFPEDPYEDVRPGATFTIREGPLVVGFGVILSRSQ